MDSTWFSSDFDTFVTGGVGFGAYLTPRFRADVTVDVRGKNTIHADAEYTYVHCNCGTEVRGTLHDRTETRNAVALANVYWDLIERGNRFVPYIGIGAGFAVRSFQRDYSGQEDLYASVPNTYMYSRTYSGEATSHQFVPAASATVGVGWTLSPSTVVDLNYRYTYIAEASFSTNIASIPHGFGSTSTMTVGEVHEHALRAGVRWNVW
jgi:opacity protein-like surface antigen